MAEIGCVRTGQLRRPNAHEMQITECAGLRVRGREAQPVRLQLLNHQLLQAGLIERHPACCQLLDLLGVDIHPEDLVAKACHRRGVAHAQVTRANDCQSHVAPGGDASQRPGAVPANRQIGLTPREQPRQREPHRRTGAPPFPRCLGIDARGESLGDERQQLLPDVIGLRGGIDVDPGPRRPAHQLAANDSAGCASGTPRLTSDPSRRP